MQLSSPFLEGEGEDFPLLVQSCFSSLLQKPGGLLFPDKAQLFLCAIEDRQYKEDKIYCRFNFTWFHIYCLVFNLFS